MSNLTAAKLAEIGENPYIVKIPDRGLSGVSNFPTGPDCASGFAGWVGTKQA